MKIPIQIEGPKAFHIITVNATDEDSDSSISFRLQGSVNTSVNNQGDITHASTVNTLFEIISMSGELSSRGTLDRESLDHFQFYILACDSANPTHMLISTATLSIQLLDYNDVAPRFFGESTAIFSVTENCPIDTFLGALNARDDDLGENGQLSRK